MKYLIILNLLFFSIVGLSADLKMTENEKSYYKCIAESIFHESNGLRSCVANKVQGFPELINEQQVIDMDEAVECFKKLALWLSLHIETCNVNHGIEADR